MTLPDRWQATWHALGVTPPAGLLDELLRRYAEPQRHYHTVQHLEECLSRFDLLRDDAADPAQVELALWFHDAVYDVRAHDNEAASARLARDTLADPALGERIAALVMATCHDAAPPDADAELLVDADLGILGEPAARFDEFERQIRAEYAFVPETVYEQKRAEVMARFARRDCLFRSAPMRERYEAQARANLARYCAEG